MHVSRSSTRTVATIALALVCASTARAAFPGENGRIAFYRDGDVWTVAADGSDETNLTQDPALDADQRWSADGTRIVFTSDREGNRDVWVMDADGGNPTQITTDPADDLQPSWSPDGTKILFMTERDGDREIYVIDADGTNPVNLTNSPGTDDDDEAHWSPDGSTISFYRSGDVWLMDADGSNQRNATNAPGSADFDQNWSPDGTKMVFDSDRDGDREIFLMDADGGNQVQLTFNADRDRQPVFSPDGTKILFESDRDGPDQLYVMDVDGQNQQRLVESATDDQEPDWQPIVSPPLGNPVAGKKLLLKDDAAKPQKRRLLVLLKDPAIDVANDSADDPVAAGGSLRVRSSAGGFTQDYDLPATGWRYKGKQGKNKGYLFKGDGPIVKVVVKNGKLAKVVGKGEALVQSLDADPDPVHVALGIGGTTYCASFDGKKKFAAGKKYLAKKPPLAGSCAAFETQCGDGILDPGESCPLLEGPSDGLAIDATFDYDDVPAVTEAERDVDADGRSLVRTRIELAFDETATVGQVNALIDGVGGRIIAMIEDVPAIVLLLPDPGTVAALDAVVSALDAEPIVPWVRKAYEFGPGVLPSNYSPGSADLPKLDHQLAIRAAAAWHARRARRGDVPVVVKDWFGNDAPDATLVDVSGLPNSDFGNVGLGPTGDHGYHVLATIAGTFGGAMTNTGLVTGIVGDTQALRVVDHRILDSLSADTRAIHILKNFPGPAVLSTSIIYTACGLAQTAVETDALSWITKVRQAGLESRVLHMTCAGNRQPACLAETAAATGGPYAAAALLTLTQPVANLTNILAIENARNDAGPAFAPRCLSSGSKFPGHLAAIGSDVWSLTDKSGSAGNKSGCSMATPQAAGLAAYVWSIDPGMTRQQVMDVLTATATPLSGTVGAGDCGPVDPKPVIDAYAAVLAVDEAVLPTPATAPVRLAVLDTNDDGDFDEDDLVDYHLHLIDQTSDALQEPTDPEFERWDLNGDGYTGGALRTAPFDLDRVGSTQYGARQLTSVEQLVEGASTLFDETGLNDLEILCYYAYSDLYTGSVIDRADVLGSKYCSAVSMDVDFPGGVLLEGQSATLTVTLGQNTPTGSQPLEGETIQLLPTGATASPSGGVTDAQGMFSSSITAGTGVSSLQVVVRAVSTADGTPLGEQTVTAQVQPNVPGTVSFESGRCNFNVTSSAALSSTVLLNDGGGLGGSTEPMPFADSDTAGGSIGLPGVGSATVDASAAVDGHFITDVGGTRIGVHYSGDAAYGAALVVEGPSNLTPYANGGGHAACSLTFEVLDGVVPYHIVASSNAAGSDAGDQRAFVALAQVNGGPQVFLIESGTVDQMGALLPARYGYTFTARASGGTSGGTVDGMAMLTADLILGTGTPTTTMMITTTSTTSSTSTTTTTSTSSSTTSLTATSTTSTTTSTSTSTTLFAVPVVPYARYVATGPDGPVVMLADEFATESVDLGAVALELPPVTIDGLLPPDADTHQTCWAHPGGLLDTCIDVQDQFGLAPLRVGNPVAVCVPELSPAVAVDAFKCYQAVGTPIDQAVVLDDEFQMQNVMVGAPELLCTPVEVDGDPITNAGRYLVCYATTPAGAAGGQIGVENALSGGPIQVDVGAATGICVPALRQITATCQLCGNGAPDGDEECDDGNVVAGDGCSPVCRIEP